LWLSLGMISKIATAEELATELRTLLAYVEGSVSPSREHVVANLSGLMDRMITPHGEGEPDFPFSRGTKPYKALEMVLETLTQYKKALIGARVTPTLVSQVKYAEEQVSKAKTALRTLENQLFKLYQ